LWIQIKNGEKKSNFPMAFLKKSALPVFALVFFTTLVGGRINELRLLFLLFPWVIALFLFYVQQSEQIIRETLNRSGYKIYLLICVIILIPIYIVVTGRINEFTDGIYEVPYGQWIFLTCLYLFVFL